ncbi:MAG: adenylosuccinate synthetase [Lachnospiraceae bacterium]|nr:adenylosuccinate synthetase [Lachnospiraceae bacterium]
MRDIRIVIGANYGDEGKGLMTDYFAAEALGRKRRTLVICSNGGAQRGHTVTTPEGVRHVFHHFGSGTLAGADTWLPRFYIVNPMFFMNEYEELAGKGVRDIRIFMDPECPVTTPFDMITNQLLEEARGDRRHGSCGAGIWETLLRQGPGLAKMRDMTDNELMRYLDGPCRKQLQERLAAAEISGISKDWKEIIEDKGLLENYVNDLRAMLSLAELREGGILKEYDRLIFENGQGLLLDRSRREYGCHTTPSNTGLRNPAQLIRENLRGETADAECCYVSRTYLTRHGAGPFKEQCAKEEINAGMRDLTNVPNPHQGTMRYGKPDAREFRRRILEDYDSERLPAGIAKRLSIAVTHVNEYRSEPEEQADYLSDGETRDHTVFLNDAETRKQIA